jgi:hypothetical protein
MSLFWAVAFATFNAVKENTYGNMGEIQCFVLEFVAKLLGGPTCYPIDFIGWTIGPVIQLRYSFLTLLNFWNNIGECYTEMKQYSVKKHGR